MIFCVFQNASALSNSSTSVPITNTSDKSLRPLTTTLPPTVNVRRPDMLNNPGFEPDPAEEYRPSQTLSVTTAANLTSCMFSDNNGRLFQTLNLRSSRETDQLGLGVANESLRHFGSLGDSPDDWATHPFLIDGQSQHPNRRSECVPSEYSESAVQLSTPCSFPDPNDHFQNSSTFTLKSRDAHPEGCISLPSTVVPFTQCVPTLSEPISAHCFPSATLVAAGSVTSIVLGSEVTEANDALTPSGTPTHSRKNRRKSNLFQKKNEDDKKLNGIGSGRSIPLKQGFLYKRTCKPLSKEWKTKKYVTLTEDARLTYHPSIHDYMENAHGKEIDLSRTTVKIPGVPFRQVGGRITKKPSTSSKNTGSSDNIPTFSDSVTPGTKDSISVKKRHRRLKPNPKTNAVDGYDSEGYEFQLISMDRQWHFEAKGPEERDEWVMYIERAIMTRLQLNESSKRTRSVNTTATGSGFTNSTTGCNASVPTNRSVGDTNSLTSGRSGAGDTSELAVTERFVRCISAVAGNEYCADCGAPDPDWASLNLGVVVCISCSGIHRQLGTHISRIRSLHLDEWSPESVSVMCAIGNTLANSVWEAAVPVNAGNRKKPEPSGSREEKEAWIRAKYDHQEFLPPLPYPDAPLQQQLIDAIARQDTRQVVLCLALATPETVNAAYSRQDPRAAIHIAATLGNLVYLQLLLWYNGDPTITDHEGRNAYYYAHCSQKYDCADFLRRNGCPKQLVPPNTPALSVGPLARSLQSAPLSQPQTLPIIHGQLGSSGLYPLSVPIEAHGSFAGHSSTTIPSTAAQPYHFSHLQQQQSGSVACHTAGLAPSHPPFSSQQPGFVPIFVNPVTTSSQSYLHGPAGSSGAATHSSVLQSVSNAALPTPPSGMVGSNSGGLAYRSTCGQQFPVTSTAYTVSVNQALGATLPRRRAPPSNIVSAAVQQFNQHSSQNHPLSTGTHRPHSGALIDRAVVGVVRPSLIGVPSPASSTPITTAYDRTTAIAAALTGNPSGTYQHLVTSNQEVGL
ncbi:hypothetical protein P879_08989 [Paragonimus westermani]|uniref:Arf-GAP with GTPase, ANK repeat and PH domain-containing protein 1/3 n=1 Tax=Paragonimus westermani TaxID=34504 RepID=A0A8T0D8G9_9TREM|nr:hypothetical protein P879_08989 [Paragonimus westermani]